jgi:hypothetical protein
MSKIKYGYLNAPQFVTWARKTDANLHQASLASFAYISLRNEGKVQISFDSLEARLGLIRIIEASIGSGGCEPGGHAILLTEWARANPGINPVQLGMAFITMVVDGAKRLGVWAAPGDMDNIVASSPWAAANVVAHASVRSEEPADMELVRGFMKKAPPVKHLTTPTKMKKVVSKTNYPTTAPLRHPIASPANCVIATVWSYSGVLGFAVVC